jgi:hypothetical protein
MTRPFRTLFIAVVLVLAALTLVAVAAAGLQELGIRGASIPTTVSRSLPCRAAASNARRCRRGRSTAGGQ